MSLKSLKKPTKNEDRSDFISPHGIDYAWEATTNLPEAFGWIVNHLLSMLTMSGSYYSAGQISITRQAFIDAVQNNPGIAKKAYEDVITEYLLRSHLTQLLKGLKGNPAIKADVRSIGNDLRRLLRMEYKGDLTHSKDWTSILARIRRARQWVASLKDVPAHRNCLDYILSAFIYAASDETPTTGANIIREMANASQCIGTNSAKTYDIISYRLLYLLKHPSKKSLKTAAPISQEGLTLLQRLGTFTPVLHTKRPA